MISGFYSSIICSVTSTVKRDICEQQFPDCRGEVFRFRLIFKLLEDDIITITISGLGSLCFLLLFLTDTIDCQFYLAWPG